MDVWHGPERRRGTGEIHERLATLEEQVRGLRADMGEIKASLRPLAEATALGRAAVIVSAKIGTVLILAAAAFGWAFDRFVHIPRP